jgi:hypothetical protein
MPSNLNECMHSGLDEVTSRTVTSGLRWAKSKQEIKRINATRFLLWDVEDARMNLSLSLASGPTDSHLLRRCLSLRDDVRSALLHCP